jgi:hypothetical protein
MLSTGALLEKTREEKGLTIDDVAGQLFLTSEQIRDIEAERWDDFYAPIYLEGAIRAYALVLGLDPNRVVAYLRRDYTRRKPIGILTTAGVTKRHAITISVRGLIVGLMVVVFLLYVGRQVYELQRPPYVEIIHPKAIRFRNVEKILVSGRTEKEAFVTVAGASALTDREGNFSSEVRVAKGANKIEIEVTAASGKKTKVTKEVVVD